MIKAFDLDALTDQREPREPFRFTLGGEEFTLTSPGDLDWRGAEHVSAADSLSALLLQLGDEQAGRFRAHPLPIWKLTALVRASREYYEGPSQAAGESDG